MRRLVRSRFGRVIEGIRENEARMQAIGYANQLASQQANQLLQGA